MKKLAMLLGALALMVVFSASQAGAALLGIRGYLPTRPDIHYDAGGTISYDSQNQLFKLIAWDQTLYLEPVGTPDPGIDIGSKVGMGIAIKVDNAGNFVGGVASHTYTWGTTSYTTHYDMIEYVLEPFSFEWRGTTYSFNRGDIFLAAEVKNFGWDVIRIPPIIEYSSFDFLFDTVSGRLVDYGLWPYPDPLSGAYVDLTDVIPGWNGSWGPITIDKGDKIPTPEPSGLLLLGSGLLGFGGFFRARFGRKKRG